MDNLNSKRYQAPPDLFAKLNDIGSIANKCPKCEVISLKTASKVLKSLQVQSEVITSLLQKTEATLVPPPPSSLPKPAGDNEPELQANSGPAPEGQEGDDQQATGQAHYGLLEELVEFQTDQAQQHAHMLPLALSCAPLVSPVKPHAPLCQHAPPTKQAFAITV